MTSPNGGKEQNFSCDFEYDCQNLVTPSFIGNNNSDESQHY